MTNYALASRIKSVLDHWDGARLEFTPVDPQRDIFTATPVNSNIHIRDLRIRQHQHEKHYASGSAISHKDNYTYHQPKECIEITHARLATIFTSGPRCTRTQTRKHSASSKRNYGDRLSVALRRILFPYTHIHPVFRHNEQAEFGPYLQKV